MPYKLPRPHFLKNIQGVLRSTVIRKHYGRTSILKNSVDHNFGLLSDNEGALQVHEVLSKKNVSNFTINDSASLGLAISQLVDQKLASALAVDEKGEISGIFTARDVLKVIDSYKSRGLQKALEVKVADFMTKKDKMIFCLPTDTVAHCRETMCTLKIRNLPVIENGEVLGIINAKDLADSSFKLSEIGGKKGYMHTVIERKGLPTGTVLNSTIKEAEIAKHTLELRHTPKLSISVGSCELPHPYKRTEGVASSRRSLAMSCCGCQMQFGAEDLNNDASLCEDAHFTVLVSGQLSAGDGASVKQPYVCVADGVGSWRQYGVDPREYAHRLVENTQKVIQADEEKRLKESKSFFFKSYSKPIHPRDALTQAWVMTGGPMPSSTASSTSSPSSHSGEGVMGSCTICLATVDPYTSQLSYSNLGDCGLLVVRHIDSEIAGYMRDRQKPRHLRNSDLRLAYVSQQQLRSFNRPYQLGYSTFPEHQGLFEDPNDADTASIPVMAGDIVVLATDGLFDNIDLDEIVTEVSAWELEWFPSFHPEPTLEKQQAAVAVLAERLANKARTVSLDESRDSPFAVLAKENDILWSGGMPDDTTVAVLRLSGRL